MLSWQTMPIAKATKISIVLLISLISYNSEGLSLQKNVIFQMLEKFSENIQELKSTVSLRYVDSSMREKTLAMLWALKEAMPDIEICQEYIHRMQDAHEKYMQSVSKFIDSFTSSFVDFSNNIEIMQQDYAESNKQHEDEKTENQSMVEEMGHKIEILNQQLINKEEEIRQLNNKIEERDALIDNEEKESNQYLKKIEQDFIRQQKALQQSYNIVRKLEEEIVSLRNHNDYLTEFNSLMIKSVTNTTKDQAIAIEEDRVINQTMTERSDPENDETCSLVRCSMISSNSCHGLEQFQELKQMQAHSKGMLDSMQEHEIPQKIQTLKDMLNMSVEKQYKMIYSKCESIEAKYSKQNFNMNDFRLSRSKDAKEMWNMNNSLEFMPKNTQKLNIREFNLPPAASDSRKDNPYYFYFLIVSQNAKINCEYFEQICSMSTQKQWQYLQESHLPLHQWESHIRKTLLQEARLLK